MLADARAVAGRLTLLDAERWASGWLGRAWLAAELGEREPEHLLVVEVVGRTCTRPSPHGLAAVAALRRVAPASERPMLDDTVGILAETQPAPPWLNRPMFAPVRAWRAADPWESERVLFIEYAEDKDVAEHCLMAQVVEPGGTTVLTMGVLHPDAPQRWASLHAEDPVPMPLMEVTVAGALADLAAALRRTDMLWPRHDDEDFVQVRALAWSRCRDHLPPWPDLDEADVESDATQATLLAEFVAEAAGDLTLSGIDATVLRGLAERFVKYGAGYIGVGPLAWSPGWVELFLVDWLPRKTFLDADERAALPAALRAWLRFALTRRGLNPQWIPPVLDAVDTHLADFTAAVDDTSAWGPAKQIAAYLQERGVDVTDRSAVDAAISQYNAGQLARRLISDKWSAAASGRGQRPAPGGRVLGSDGLPGSER